MEGLTCLNVARGLPRAARLPLVLNMAAAGKPGGGVCSGAGAQEEQLFRSSNYAEVYNHSHGHSFDHAVYTSKVTFFRGAAGLPNETGEGTASWYSDGAVMVQCCCLPLPLIHLLRYKALMQQQQRR